MLRSLPLITGYKRQHIRVTTPTHSLYIEFMKIQSIECVSC